MKNQPVIFQILFSGRWLKQAGRRVMDWFIRGGLLVSRMKTGSTAAGGAESERYGYII